MVEDKGQQTKGPGGDGGEQPDPRAAQLVAAFMPAPGDDKAREEQKQLGTQISKQLEDAQKKASGGKLASVAYAIGDWPPTDAKEAEARFFAGDTFGAEARKKEVAEQQKQEKALQAAYRSGGNPPVPPGKQ